MADAWAELQALKFKRDSRRKRLEERKKERQEILRGAPAALSVTSDEKFGTWLVCAGIFHDDDDNDFKTKVG
jgi:hypothetical protein